MKVTLNTLATHRIYDLTGGGVTEDIIADSLEDAMEQGREWIEAGDWNKTSYEQTLRCAVAEIVRDEDEEIDDQATWENERHDCSGTLAAEDGPECLDGATESHDWKSPYSVLGGCKENPGVWGSGHGQVVIKSVCACCGRYRTTDHGATDSSDGTQCTSTTYSDADADSLAWIMRRLKLPKSIEIKGVDVSLEWDKSADITDGDAELGRAIHTVEQSALDAGIADGPYDGETFEHEGIEFRLGSHDYETEDGETTCTATIYRVL